MNFQTFANHHHHHYKSFRKFLVSCLRNISEYRSTVAQYNVILDDLNKVHSSKTNLPCYLTTLTAKAPKSFKVEKKSPESTKLCIFLSRKHKKSLKEN